MEEPENRPTPARLQRDPTVPHKNLSPPFAFALLMMPSRHQASRFLLAPVAEMPGTTYAACTSTQLTAFTNDIFTELLDCSTKASYDWSSTVLPTDTQRRQICACKLLSNKLQSLKVPHCALSLDGELYSVKGFVEYAFGLCGSGPSTTSTIQPVTTTTPLTMTPIVDTIPTSTPYTYPPIPTAITSAPLFGQSTSASSPLTHRTGFIAGIAVGVVVVGGIGSVMARRRRRRHALRTHGRAPEMCVDVVPVATEVVHEPSFPTSRRDEDDKLSPSITAYARAPLTPSAPDAKYMN